MRNIQAVRIPRKKSSQLRALRTLHGLEVHEADDAIWLRVTESSDEIQKALSGLPMATTYRVLEEGQLCQMGGHVPHGYLPEGPWERLSKGMPVELPHASLPAQLPNRIPLRLIRDSRPRAANILLASMEHWLAYGTTAPQVRLDCWQFAVSRNRQVLVRGVPLPPIPGTHFVEECGVAVPCGWHWSPAVDGDVLARAFSQSEGNILLWCEEGRIEQIAAEEFVRATRSAIRLSAEAVSHA